MPLVAGALIVNGKMIYLITEQAVADARVIPIANLKTQPWFDPFPFADLFSNNSSTANAAVAEHRSELLSRAIPALSHATGSHPVTKAGMIDVDINTQCRNGIAWPEERGTKPDNRSWLHSDFKDVSYLYVFKLFDQIVEGKGC
jgi:hypothetical protein